LVLGILFAHCIMILPDLMLMEKPLQTSLCLIYVVKNENQFYIPNLINILTLYYIRTLNKKKEVNRNLKFKHSRYSWQINVKKTCQFKVNVKDDNYYDACQTANIKISGRQNLAKWALTCYGGSTHERLLSESSRLYMLEYYLSLYVLLLRSAHWRKGHHSKHIF
jgi:hypothetical protein